MLASRESQQRVTMGFPLSTRHVGRSPHFGFGLAALLSLTPAGRTVAQAPAQAPAASPAAATNPASTPTAPPARPLDARQYELRGVQDNIRQSQEQRQKIESEIESIRADRARLSAALIDTTAKAQGAETRVGEVEKRLEVAKGSEEAIRRSLEGRRAVIAEVLAALQRMGRKPPPAVVVSPEDMLQAVRTSMLLGAVVPELRSETEALAADLGELVRLRQAIVGERATLAESLSTLGFERQRLAALVEERRKAQGNAEAALTAEGDRARDLAKQAADLKDLITKMEAESARHSADVGRDPAVSAAIPPGPLHDPARLGPALAFAESRGQLHLPVSGSLLKGWGAADGYGGTEKGLSMATRPGAVVAAPADGRVVFSGPYRSYGQLLILSAGGGYHLVLAGMDRINVEVGQFVLAGEPIGTMGDGSAKTAAAIAIGAAQPVLYVEFRKDGAAIDPGPWWARPDMEKARG